MTDDGRYSYRSDANGQKVAQRRSDSGLSYLHQDHLGSSVRMTNASGTVVRDMVYEPYGETAYSAGSGTTRYKFTGQEEDAAGVYYFHARYYEPELGRFLQADTVLDGLNRYAYCGNNPVVDIDPMGHYYDYYNPNGDNPGAPSTKTNGAESIPTPGENNGYSGVKTSPGNRPSYDSWYTHVESDPMNFVDPLGLYTSDAQATQTISDVAYLMNVPNEPWSDPSVTLPNTNFSVYQHGCAVMAAADISGKTPTEILSNTSAFKSNGDIIWGPATGMNAQLYSGELSQQTFEQAQSSGASIAAEVSYDTSGGHHFAPVKGVSSNGEVTIKATSVNDSATGANMPRGQAGWTTNSNGDPTVPAWDVTAYVVLTP